jgi:hypothetical protein
VLPEQVVHGTRAYQYDVQDLHLPPIRRPYADWFYTEQIGYLGHIPVSDGRWLPHIVMIDRDPLLSTGVEEIWSNTIVQRLTEFDVRFSPWSSGRCSIKHHLTLCFYFTELDDAALFKLLWG